MASILVKLRHQAFSAQQGRCFYCHLPMWEQNGKAFARQHGVLRRNVPHLRCTAEHLTARQDQGKDVPQNIVAACRWCNQQRHCKPGAAPDPQTWQRQVRTLVACEAWHPAATANLVPLPMERPGR